MTENQHDTYKDTPGLDSKVGCEGIDSLLGSNCGEKMTCPSEDHYHCKRKLVFVFQKYISAQMNTYEKAFKEIKNGEKRTRWMWFVFPQLRGFGISDMAHTYGSADLDEASCSCF